MANKGRKSGSPETAPSGAAWLASPVYSKGIDLFNRGHYFDAHEVLEDLWRETHGPARQFLQGLIQVAVAMHHHRTGNDEGARSVLERAARNLEAYAQGFGGLDVGALRTAVSTWRAALAGGLPSPAAIHIRRAGTGERGGC